MSRIFSWFYHKNKSSLTTIQRKNIIESLIVDKQIKEFASFITKKDNQTPCVDGFFLLLPTINDASYLTELFEIIKSKSRLTPAQLCKIVNNQLSRTILNQDFELYEKILHLPFLSTQILLPTYELTQLIHRCSDKDQLIRCLSILIQKNLSFDAEYISWILIVLFEYYETDDEIIIDYVLNIKQDSNVLFTSYGNNNITPLMLYFHIYTNNKCRTLIDHHCLNIKDESILLQCDTWNRSYLTHLLCGQCQHSLYENTSKILSNDLSDIKADLLDRCPHASVILSKFSMLHKLGNKCDAMTKTILTSQYCLPLRILSINYLQENDSSFELKLNEFFINFPPTSIYTYSNYLKQLIRHQNLNQALVSVIHNRRNDDHSIEHTIEFLLQQGARIDNMSDISSIISNLLVFSRSKIPFILLDYSFYINVPFHLWNSNQSIPRLNLYICRLIQCGYPSEFRMRFDEFKSSLSPQVVPLIEKFINVKNPDHLSKLCLQKLRGSLTHLGDEIIEKLNDYLPNQLNRSIIRYGYNECITYYRTVMLSG